MSVVERVVYRPWDEVFVKSGVVDWNEEGDICIFMTRGRRWGRGRLKTIPLQGGKVSVKEVGRRPKR